MDSNSLWAPIRLLNPHRPVCCASGSPAREAIALMQEQSIGCILVVHDGKLAGILSERDILGKLASQNFEPGALAVEALMIPNPETLQADDWIAFAVNHMHVSGYRHIPIVDPHEHPIGIISIKDLIRFVVEELDREPQAGGLGLPLRSVSLEDENLDDELTQMAEQSENPEVVLSNETFALPLSRVCSREPVSVPIGTTLRQAVRIMVERSISALAVVEGKVHLRGIFTDHDVLVKLAGRETDLDTMTVGQMMHTGPETLALDDPLAAALRLMNDGRYRHVPLVDDERRLVGMVSIRDIFGFVAQHFLGDILNLPPRPIRKAMQAVEGA